MFRLKGALIALITLFIVTGCGGGGGGATINGSDLTASNLATTTTVVATPTPTTAVIALFDPTTGKVGDIPLPNSLLSNPTTGKNNLPQTGQPYTSFNAISGFSTSAPIYLPFSGALDGKTLPNNVVLYDADRNTTTTNVTIGTSTAIGSYITITPVTPLKGNTNYMVFVTNGVKDTNGNSVQSSDFMTLMKSPYTSPVAQVEPYRQMWQPIWTVGETKLGFTRQNLAEAFQFKTQPIGNTLKTMRATVQAGTPTFTINAQAVGTQAVDGFYTAVGLAAAPHANIGMVFKGTYTSPNYVPNPLTTNISFDANGNPVVASTGNVPFLVTIPANATQPVPVIIYQHGITRTKYDMLVVADAAAQAGFGMIAIDAVLHGERSAVINGVTQPSGTGFVNLQNPLLVRDNFYQTYSDMYGEVALIQKGITNFDGGQTPLFAPITSVGFIGQSLGGIMGGTFMGTEANAKVGVLNVPGGRIAYLLNNSATFGPQIQAGLAAQGIKPNTAEYTLFLWIVQTVIDDIDPFNYGPRLLAGTANTAPQVGPSRVLVQEMIDDQVVPNSATTDLVLSIATGGTFVQVNPVSQIIGTLTAVTAPIIGSGVYQYTGGKHGFLLDPTQGPTAKAQTQAITYIGSFFLTSGKGTIIDPFAAGKSEPADWFFDGGLNNARFIWP